MPFADECEVLKQRIHLLSLREKALTDELLAVRNQLAMLKTTYTTYHVRANGWSGSLPPEDWQLPAINIGPSCKSVLHRLFLAYRNNELNKCIKHIILETGTCVAFVLLCLQIIFIML